MLMTYSDVCQVILYTCYQIVSNASGRIACDLLQSFNLTSLDNGLFRAQWLDCTALS